MRTVTESRTRLAIVALLIVAIATSACEGLVSSSPSPTASFVPSGTIDWQSCPVTDPVTGGNPELLCATITEERYILAKTILQHIFPIKVIDHELRTERIILTKRLEHVT